MSALTKTSTSDLAGESIPRDTHWRDACYTHRGMCNLTDRGLLHGSETSGSLVSLRLLCGAGEARSAQFWSQPRVSDDYKERGWGT